MTLRFQIRHGTAAEWASVDPILELSELAHETDTDKLKIGDGVKHWNSLEYFTGLLAGADNVPIGGVVILNVSDNPAVLFGFGSWIQVGQGATIKGHQ